VTIGTGDLVNKAGTQTLVSAASPSSVASAAFSASGDVASSGWTNTDSVPFAAFALKCQWATVTGVANKVINLYARAMDIQSTNDAVQPSANRKGTLIGWFVVYAASTGTDYWFNIEGGYVPLPELAEGQVYEFYLENLTGQTISANWALYARPLTRGPKA